jgi:hypothetical protein
MLPQTRPLLRVRPILRVPPLSQLTQKLPRVLRQVHLKCKLRLAEMVVWLVITFTTEFQIMLMTNSLM